MTVMKNCFRELRSRVKGKDIKRVIILLHNLLSIGGFTIDDDLIIDLYKLLKNKKGVPSDIMAIIDDRYWGIIRDLL